MVVQQFSINSSLVCLRASLMSDWIWWCFTCNSGQTAVCFMHQQKTQTGVVALCGVQQWRVMYVCGVGAVSLRSCLSAAGDSCVPSPLFTGLSRSVGCAFLRNCTCRGTPGAFGPCTAPRTSHSPSSFRACHLRQHGDMGQCGVPEYALGRT